MKYIEFDGDKYKIETDINGSPNRLSRYNKNHGVHISLFFTGTENPALIAETRNDLKDIFITQFKLLTDKD